MAVSRLGTTLFAIGATVLMVLLSGLAMPSLIHNPSVRIERANPSPAVNSSIAEVPIVVSNSQTVPTTNPFNLKVVVDSSNYTSYESQHLGNVYWTTVNNVLIPSWIQSGNSNLSTGTTYWLKLPFSIGPHSNVTILLKFDYLSVNLFSSNGYEGEFPTATIPYGQYDNGANVFLLYDNFSGTSLNVNKWRVVYNNSGASYQVDNGLTVSGAVNNGYISVVTNQKYSGIYESYLEYTGTSSWGGSGFFLGLAQPETAGGYYGFNNGYSFFVTDNRPGTGYGSYIMLLHNGSTTILNNSANQVVSNYIMKVSWSSTDLNWTNQGIPLVTAHNYTFSPQAVYFDIWVGGDLTNAESATYQYARVITDQPNGVMPISVFGKITGVIDPHP